MGDENCEGCFFRCFQQEQGTLPQKAADVFSLLADMQEPETPGGFAEAINMVETPICAVPNCGLTTLQLMDFAKSGLVRLMGADYDAPRRAIDDAVAPGCAILDIPHQLDVDRGSFGDDWPDGPVA